MHDGFMINECIKIIIFLSYMSTLNLKYILQKANFTYLCILSRKNKI